MSIKPEQDGGGDGVSTPAPILDEACLPAGVIVERSEEVKASASSRADVGMGWGGWAAGGGSEEVSVP